MINAHESGSNSPVVGTFSRFDQNKVPALQGFYLGFAYGKIDIPAIPQPSGDVVANDWCIMEFFRASLYVCGIEHYVINW